MRCRSVVDVMQQVSLNNKCDRGILLEAVKPRSHTRWQRSQQSDVQDRVHVGSAHAT